MRVPTIVGFVFVAVTLCTACDDPVQTSPVEPAGFSSVTVGTDHTCALTVEGVAYCWGRNWQGQLGTGDTIPSAVPRRVSTQARFHSLAVSSTSYGVWSCGTSKTDRLVCWGNAPFVPNGSSPTDYRYPQPQPTEMMPELALSYLRGDSGFGLYQCLLTKGGEAYCWSRGYPFRHDEAHVVRASGEHRFTQVATASWAYGVGGGGVSNDVYLRHACAIKSGGEAFCWGTNTFGSLGNGTYTSSPVPVKVSADLRFREIHAAKHESFGLAVDGTLYRWGGVLYSDTVSVPTKIAGQTIGFRTVAVGVRHSCAVGFDNRAYCWSRYRDMIGVLGQGEVGILRETPQPVQGELAFRSISVGGANSCGVTIQSAIYCWGAGPLGDGTTTPSAVPMRVGLPD